MSTRKKVAAAVIASGVVGGFVGSALQDLRDTQERPAHSVSIEQARKLAVQAAVKEQRAHESAVSMAATYSDSVNRGYSVNNVNVLNGEIQIQGKDGKYIPAYRNPIILSTFDQSPTPDLKGDFMQGGWLGIVSNDAEGNIDIVPIAYGDAGTRFVPYDQAAPELTVGMYSTVVQHGGPATPGHYLVAFDPTGNQSLHNPDGSVVVPGESFGK